MNMGLQIFLKYHFSNYETDTLHTALRGPPKYHFYVLRRYLRIGTKTNISYATFIFLFFENFPHAFYSLMTKLYSKY